MTGPTGMTGPAAPACEDMSEARGGRRGGPVRAG